MKEGEGRRERGRGEGGEGVRTTVRSMAGLPLVPLLGYTELELPRYGELYILKEEGREGEGGREGNCMGHGWAAIGTCTTTGLHRAGATEVSGTT